MDLVERYIEAVKFWLPKKLRDDIAAELREDIRSEIDEAEHEKGRPLTVDEVAAILKARGKPMTVASRYLPQHALIGPELYPIYIFVLKIVAGVFLLLPIAIWLITTATSGHLAFHNFPEPFTGMLTAFAIVTLIFAIIERKGVQMPLDENWNPKTLPPVSNPNRIKRGESVGEIIGSLIVIGFYAAGYLSQTTYHLFSIQISSAGNQFVGTSVMLSPEWIPYWQFIVVVVIAELGLSAVNLFKPYWDGVRILVRLAIDLTKLGAICWLFQSHLLRAISAPGLTQDAAAKIVGISDMAAQFAGLFGVLVAIGIVIAAVTRTVHLFRGRSHALA